MRAQLDRLYLVCCGWSDADTEYDAAKEKDLLVKAMKTRLAAWQAVEDKREAPSKGKGGGGLFDRLKSLVLRRMQVRITNVHVRMQEQRGAHDVLAFGVVFKSLSMVDLDDDDEVGLTHAEAEAQQQATSGISGWRGSAKKKAKHSSAALRKRVQLSNFALYLTTVSGDLAAEASEAGRRLWGFGGLQTFGSFNMVLPSF